MEKTERLLKFLSVFGLLQKQISRLRSLAMERAGLKSSDLPVLIALDLKKEGLKMEEIVAKTQTDKAQISRTVRGLLEQGMIEKQGGGKYKNRYLLTEKGSRLMDKINQVIELVFEEAHGTLDDEIWSHFYHLCKSLDAQIEETLEHPESLLSLFTGE